MTDQEQSRTTAVDKDQQATSPATRQQPPEAAQNPTNPEPHTGKHSPDNAQVGTSDGDDNRG